MREGRDNLAEYELNTPGVVVTAVAGDKTCSLSLGKAPDASRRYALWSEPALVLFIDSATANTLSKDVVSTPSPTNAAPAALPSTK